MVMTTITIIIITDLSVKGDWVGERRRRGHALGGDRG
jgi:hypothetical protein